MSISKRRKENGQPFKSMDHNNNKFLTRITKTLYYGKLPRTDRLSLPVSEMASELFSETQQKNRTLQRLYCEDAALISRNACVSPCSFVLALLYLERLKECNPEYLKNVAPSKLFLVSLMVSNKFLYDDGISEEVIMDEWAKSGEITVSELCQLEKEFLKAIEWNVFVHESTFWERLEKLEKNLALREGNKRGWFTYTELNTIIKIYGVTDLFNAVIAASTIILATYTVGILTLLGSVFLTSQIPGTVLYSKTARAPIDDAATRVIVDSAVENDTSLDLSIYKAIASDIYDESSNSVLDAVNVLKTGIILASIKPCNNDSANCGSENTNTSWDWWNNPVMNWLTRISAVRNFETVTLPSNYYKNFAHDKLVDMIIASQKKLDLEDKIHKATKVRLQDQLERSWHQEWTDTLYAALQPLFSSIRAL